MSAAAELRPSLTSLIRAGNVASLLERLAEPAFPQELHSRDEEGHTSLHWAALSSPTVLAMLLPFASNVDTRSTNPAQLHQSPLHWACVSASLENIKALLSAGADPSLKDANGYDAPIHAAQYGRVAVLHIILSKYPILANTVDNESHSLLQWAAYYGHHHCVQYFLLLYDMDINGVDSQGATAMHRAAQRDHHLVVRALIHAGADGTINDIHGKTACNPVTTKSNTLLPCYKLRKNLSKQSFAHDDLRKSSTRYILVMFYYLMITTSYIKFSQLTFGTGLLSIPLLALSHVLLFVSFASHVMATFGNPGDITKGTRASFKHHIENCVDNNRDVFLLPSAYCYTCLAEKPPRSKHSSERDVCVRMFDHECPWLNNSIGLSTRRQFFLLVLSTPLLQLVFIFSAMRIALRSPSILSFLRSFPFLSALVLLHSVTASFCFMLLVTQIQLISQGRSTYEHIVAIRDMVTSNPYDRGPWQNIVAFASSTGYGTGHPLAKVSLKALTDVVFSCQKSVSRKEREASLAEGEEFKNPLPTGIM